MNIKITIFFIIFLSSNYFLYNIDKPYSIDIYKGKIYVIDKYFINILDLEGNTIKTFGNRGEGPGEFKIIPCDLDFIDNKIMIDGISKVYFYDLDGNYLNEFLISYNLFVNDFIPFNGGYIGVDDDFQKTYKYKRIILLDSKFKEIECFEKYKIKRDGKIYYLSNEIKLVSGKDKFIYNYIDNIINIYEDGNINKIDLKIKRIKFTKKDMDKHIERFNSNSRRKSVYDMIKSQLVFPEYYPFINKLFLDNDKLYIITNDKELNIYVYDLSNMKCNKYFFNFDDIEIYCFYNNAMYYIIEQDEDYKLIKHELNK